MTCFAEINGYRLRYRIAGEGPLGVFGHGLLGSIEQLEEYSDVLREIERHTRLVTYDARGHGESSGSREMADYTWESLGRDMLALAMRLSDEPVIFGGASMGAATALWIALERPERCRALVLVMPPPLGGPELQTAEEREAIQVLSLMSAAVRNYGVERTIELARNLPGFSGEGGAGQLEWLRRVNPLALGYAAGGLVAAPFHDPEAYRRIRVPTLVMAHEGDGLHPARAARLLGEKVPGAIVRIAPSADHWRRNPREFVAEVSRFLDGVG